MSRRSLPIASGHEAAESERSAELGAALRAAISGEVRFDAYSRHLFSTDASMYAIEPMGVVFPRDGDDVVAVVEVANRFGVPILPRGGGTSLNGQAEGRAIVLDFSRHMNGVVELDPEARIARVQPGLVQDDLNRAAASHGLLFAPDTSTGNRATLGGMIGNNSSGARSARYGMTVDHVDEMEVVLSDGSRAELGPRSPAEITRHAGEDSLEGRIYRDIPAMIAESADIVRAAMPAHWRRAGGYRLDRLLPESGPLNLAKLVVGSEGTLAVAVEATVRLVPAPTAIAALVGHFKSVAAAIEAAPSAMDCGATTVELVDRMILNLARVSPVHRHLTSHLVRDPAAILWVEFYGDSPAEARDRMARLERRWAEERRGYAVVAAPTAREQRGFRELRKAGLGLLMNAGHGRERSLAFIEDTAVDPARLAEYTRRLAALLKGHGLRAGFYGHVSVGTLHIRPFMDLTRDGEVRKMRAVAEAVLDLVREFGGMNSSEHGDGLSRAEFNRRFFGDEFYALMSEVKRTFDPEGLLNPGKKVDAPPMTDHLRDPALPHAPKLDTHFHFDSEDGMRGAANRCMRIGACRKSPGAGGTMCPSYMATRDEEHSTRGRANALVKALSAPDPGAALSDPRLREILDLCLECKACQTECPLSVDMATMKAEALAQHYARDGVPLRARMFGHVRTLNRVGSAFAPLSNLPASWGPVRAWLQRAVGIDRRRPLPRFRRTTLQKWFARRSRKGTAGGGWRREDGLATGSRGALVFLADSFSSYTEPEIGQAAIELLEAAGWDVTLASDVCCGRALVSKGLLSEARSVQAHLVERLGPLARAGVPVVGCEPSCVLTLKDEIQGLLREPSPEAEAIGRQAHLAEHLLIEAFEDGSIEPDPRSAVAGRTILFHGHCHQKAAGAAAESVRLLEAIPGAEVEVLDAGCCGMAGSFGFETEHYDLSMKIGGLRLFPAVSGSDADVLISATGVSCRQQIAQGTGRTAEHPIVLFRRAVTLG
jgi:FAD/FMN-containing dehydrogenase/Fe-S oxidoreductase